MTTIREKFAAEVDEFINDLHEFATGAYLSPGETQYWEAPFDAAALPELKAVVLSGLDGLDTLPHKPHIEQVITVIATTYAALDEFNERYANAIIEPEEQSTINDMMHRAAAETGIDEDELSELPDLE